MDANLIILVALGVFFVLLALGTPIAFSLMGAGLVGIILLSGFDVASAVLGATPFTTTHSWTLVVVPMFILMGMLAVHGQLAEHLFSVARYLLRKVPGGLGIAVVATSAGFAAVTGSSVAAVASVGKISLGEMEKAGYDKKFAAGIVGSTGTLGILIPPSVALVLYGIISGESVGKLLIAGVIPGLMTVLTYIVFIVARAKFSPSLVGNEGRGGQGYVGTQQIAVETIGAPTRARVLASMLESGPILVLFFLVVGGVYLGWFTPTEAGAVGGFGALIFMFIHSRRKKRPFFARLFESLRESSSMTSMIFALMIGAGIFSFFLISAGAPAMLTSWLVAQNIPPIFVVIAVLIAMIPLGMFLEGMSLLLIVVPLTYPAITGLGFDGIWFGILIIKMIEIGLLTPPVGLNVFVLQKVATDLSLPQAFSGVMKFLPVEIAVIAILLVFPDIVTWLPNLMM